jgi:hypothetical protein
MTDYEAEAKEICKIEMEEGRLGTTHKRRVD